MTRRRSPRRTHSPGPPRPQGRGRYRGYRWHQMATGSNCTLSRCHWTMSRCHWQGVSMQSQKEHAHPRHYHPQHPGLNLDPRPLLALRPLPGRKDWRGLHHRVYLMKRHQSVHGIRRQKARKRMRECLKKLIFSLLARLPEKSLRSALSALATLPKPCCVFMPPTATAAGVLEGSPALCSSSVAVPASESCVGTNVADAVAPM